MEYYIFGVFTVLLLSMMVGLRSSRFVIKGNDISMFYTKLKNSCFDKLILKREVYRSTGRFQGYMKELPLYSDDDKIGTREVISGKLNVYNLKNKTLYNVISLEYNVRNREVLKQSIEEYNNLKGTGIL